MLFILLATCWDEANCEHKPKGEVCRRDGNICHICTGDLVSCPKSGKECITGQSVKELLINFSNPTNTRSDDAHSLKNNDALFLPL